MAAGAHRNFKHTRSLIIEDVRLPAEPHIFGAAAMILFVEENELVKVGSGNHVVESLLKCLETRAA